MKFKNKSVHYSYSGFYPSLWSILLLFTCLSLSFHKGKITPYLHAPCARSARNDPQIWLHRSCCCYPLQLDLKRKTRSLSNASNGHPDLSGQQVVSRDDWNLGGPNLCKKNWAHDFQMEGRLLRLRQTLKIQISKPVRTPGGRPLVILPSLSLSVVPASVVPSPGISPVVPSFVSVIFSWRGTGPSNGKPGITLETGDRYWKQIRVPNFFKKNWPSKLSSFRQ